MGKYRNLEQGLKDLSEKFKKDLIDKLRQKGHVSTGNLENSITINFKDSDNKFTIQISCLDYIKYLEDGKFLTDFIEEKQIELMKVIPDFFFKDITEQINITL